MFPIGLFQARTIIRQLPTILPVGSPSGHGEWPNEPVKSSIEKSTRLTSNLSDLFTFQKGIDEKMFT